MEAACGFGPAARLRAPAEFTELRRQGKRFSSLCFSVQYRLTTQAGPRLGLAVSRRVSKRAVVRNRIRRIARESFRRTRARLPACDILLIARNAAAVCARSALHGDLEQVWGRLVALKREDATRTITPHA